MCGALPCAISSSQRSHKEGPTTPIWRWRKVRLSASPLAPGIGSDQCQTVPSQRAYNPGGVGRAVQVSLWPRNYWVRKIRCFTGQCQQAPGICVKSQPIASSPYPLHHHLFDSIHCPRAICQVPALRMPLQDFCTLLLPGQL